MMETTVLTKGVEVLPEWGTLGAFIVLVGGFLWYICRRDASMEKLVEKAFNIIDRNTEQSVKLDSSIITLSEEVRDLKKEYSR